MDREILFRGQTRRRGEKVNLAGEPVDGNWVYGGILQGTGDYSIIYGSADSDNISASNLEKHVVHTDTVGQYTGLTDKHGTKIFEGDILNENSEHFIVVYDTKWAKFKLRYTHAIQYPEWNRGVLMEVIGNRWDTPELMGGEQYE